MIASSCRERHRLGIRSSKVRAISAGRSHERIRNLQPNLRDFEGDLNPIAQGHSYFGGGWHESMSSLSAINFSTTTCVEGCFGKIFTCQSGYLPGWIVFPWGRGEATVILGLAPMPCGVQFEGVGEDVQGRRHHCGGVPLPRKPINQAIN